MEVIAIAHNGFAEKFGIPRQSGMTSAETRLVIRPAYARPEAFRGLEQFSHLWLIWRFDVPEGSRQLTVRPPRLGGNTRLGVFATRSPFRPNPLGLTVVRLLRIEGMEQGGEADSKKHEAGITLVVSGADLRDGTEILDIKPYLPYVDSVPDAQNGFAGRTADYRLKVQFPSEDTRDTEGRLFPDQQTLREIEELLAQDPRPAYQSDPNRQYGLTYKGWSIHFHVATDTCLVDSIEWEPKISPILG